VTPRPAGPAADGPGGRETLMSDGMTWGMGVWQIVILVPVVLTIAALVKYLFFS